MADFCVVFVFVFSLLYLLTTPAFSQTTSPSCKSITFSNKKTFDNCIDLPTLSAVLHYTYDPTKSTLSMGFTAPPAVSNGWVAWALNPKATGMAGAQTLLAYKPNTSSPISVNTFNIVSYSNIIKGPISYNVTGLSAEESKGVITIFATWVIPRGEVSVNVVWQVGPIIGGELSPHNFNPENLESTMKLTLVNGPAGAPAIPPAGDPTTTVAGEPVASTGDDAKLPAPAKQSGGAKKSVVSLIMVLSALLGCFL